MDNLELEYMKVYTEVIRDERLSSNEKMLYSLLRTISEDITSVVKLSNEFLASELNLTHRTLNKLLQSLEDKNLIKRHYSNGDLKQRYFEVLPYNAE